jgi:hypothetical protein
MAKKIIKKAVKGPARKTAKKAVKQAARKAKKKPARKKLVDEAAAKTRTRVASTRRDRRTRATGAKKRPRARR